MTMYSRTTCLAPDNRIHTPIQYTVQIFYEFYDYDLLSTSSVIHNCINNIYNHVFDLSITHSLNYNAVCCDYIAIE